MIIEYNTEGMEAILRAAAEHAGKPLPTAQLTLSELHDALANRHFMFQNPEDEVYHSISVDTTGLSESETAVVHRLVATINKLLVLMGQLDQDFHELFDCR